MLWCVIIIGVNHPKRVGSSLLEPAVLPRALQNCSRGWHSSNCSNEVKASAYLTLVRPQMEYASAVWETL